MIQSFEHYNAGTRVIQSFDHLLNIRHSLRSLPHQHGVYPATSLINPSTGPGGDYRRARGRINRCLHDLGRRRRVVGGDHLFRGAAGGESGAAEILGRCQSDGRGRPAGTKPEVLGQVA